ncbi:hypothetical protein [Flavobacterium sp.]|uniref:hypothetical protein n=1 Tax=Flavobacterium sp. TaxID=239 RepID=UPI00262423A1|nr:hypothetical protein [Flavobacterium sp.]
MKKIQNFKKLTKDELKLINGSGRTAGNPPPPCTNCGGTNNTGTGTNDKCGLEPSICHSAAWEIWRLCMIAETNHEPYTSCQ